MTTFIFCLLFLVCGCVIGYYVKALDKLEAQAADADELAMLRETVQAQREELAVLKEEYGDWSWVGEEEFRVRVGE